MTFKVPKALLNLVTPTAGTSSSDPATTEFVQKALGNVSGIHSPSASGNISAIHIGKWVIPTVGSLTLALPLASSVPAGSVIRVFGNNLGTTISKQSADTLYAGGATSVASIVLTAIDTATFIRTSATEWRHLEGTSFNSYSDDFQATLSGNGYQKLPSGLIIQWGATGVLSTSASQVSFPIAFPTSCFVVSLQNSTSSSIVTGVVNATATKFDGWASAGGNAHKFIAIGY